MSATPVSKLARAAGAHRLRRLGAASVRTYGMYSLMLEISRSTMPPTRATVAESVTLPMTAGRLSGSERDSSDGGVRCDARTHLGRARPIDLLAVADAGIERVVTATALSAVSIRVVAAETAQIIVQQVRSCTRAIRPHAVGARGDVLPSAGHELTVKVDEDLIVANRVAVDVNCLRISAPGRECGATQQD